MEFPKTISGADELDTLLSMPSNELIKFMKRLEGDIMILGIAGKMGGTLGRRAVNAIKEAGVSKQVIGVSRFSSPDDRKKLEEWGIRTIVCDLLDQESVRKLPQTPNVIFMAGRKFGTDGSEDITWAMNTLVPGYVAEHFRKSSIVVFSTGCVYPLRSIKDGGCSENDAPNPVGEYSQSCLGRERIFQFASRNWGTKVTIYRLNYAIDLRYGVLHDIAMQIKKGEPVCDTVPHFNAIWQGDANDYAIRALETASAPATVLNVTGPETISTRYAATELARQMKMPLSFTGTEGGCAYLNNAAKLHGMMGYPHISLAQMISWQAQWIANGGESLGKQTHFEVNNGKF